jgi:hypothetical protein
MHANEKNNPHASRAFRAMPLQTIPKLSQGEMAVPVQIDSHDIVSDPTQSNYETPLILPTGKGMPAGLLQGRSQSLLNVSKKDAQRLKQKVQSKNSLNSKLAACMIYLFSEQAKE